MEVPTGSRPGRDARHGNQVDGDGRVYLVTRLVTYSLLSSSHQPEINGADTNQKILQIKTGRFSGSAHHHL